MKIASIKNLPYSGLIVPLAAFFAEPDGKEVSYNSIVHIKLKQWFWRSCFTNRYASRTRQTTITDIGEVIKLKNGENSNFGEMNCSLDNTFFMENQFRLGTANTKTFILLLANYNPKTFLSGSSIDLDKVLQKYNRAEFHHIYPKAYLQDLKISDDQINCLANFCFISASENKKIGRKKPSEYITIMPKGEALQNILDSAFCPSNTFEDDFGQFINSRSELLTEFAQKLI